jgi:putative ABC transport system substrate-binding protein
VIRKNIGWLVVVFLMTSVSFAHGQQAGKIPRIGYLNLGNLRENAPSEAFLQGLRELGYVDGKNIIIEYRGADRREDQLPKLAAELVRLKVDVIVALSPPAAHAARNATRIIPIVMRATGDPVKAGFVESLARPGHNITGVTSISSDLYGKRLELLKEVIPGLSLVAVLHNPDRSDYKKMQSAAGALSLKLQSLEVRKSNDFADAFSTAARAHAQALITIRTPLINGQRKQVAELAIKGRLPAIYDEVNYVEAGGLMSYGTHLGDLERHAAVFVDKILKGRRPADLPMEQPTKFEFVINLKTAKQIGLTIPPNVLARADKVIK